MTTDTIPTTQSSSRLQGVRPVVLTTGVGLALNLVLELGGELTVDSGSDVALGAESGLDLIGPLLALDPSPAGARAVDVGRP